MKNVGQYLLATFGAIATIYAFAVRDAASFKNPALARIFFWHFPCSIAVCIMLFVGFYFSFEVLRKRELMRDARAAAANELGFLFGILVITTGMLFSYVQWGAFWNWDPRQTSFLLVLLIYGGYFILRASMPDHQVRAASSAVYWLFATPAQIFLILVFPHLPYIEKESLHPSQTISKGLLSGDYATAVMLTGGLFIVLTILLYRQRVHAFALLERAERLVEPGSHPVVLESAAWIYETLGLAPGCSSEEAASAFQELARQSDPAQIAHMAPEIRALAEERLRTLTSAYDELKNVNGWS